MSFFLYNGKIALFCKFWTAGWLVRFANVCNVRWDFLFEGGRKKQNKFIQVCTVCHNCTSFFALLLTFRGYGEYRIVTSMFFDLYYFQIYNSLS